MIPMGCGDPGASTDEASPGASTDTGIKDSGTAEPAVDPPQWLARALEASTWSADGPLFLYEGEDLYDHINGGAEIYHEYGFHRVWVQSLVHPAGGEALLEAYEMAGPDEAFGIYSYRIRPGGRALDAEDRGFLEDYYLNIHEGSFLFTLTAQDGEASTAETLIPLARSLADTRRGETKGPPALVTRLPGDDRLPGGVDYYRGPLGFMNGPRRIARVLDEFEEGARAVYRDNRELILLRFADEKVAAEALAKAGKALAKSDHFEDVIEKGQGFRGRLKEGPGFGLIMHNDLLVIVLSEEAPDDWLDSMDWGG